MRFSNLSAQALAIAVASASLCLAAEAPASPWMNTALPPEERTPPLVAAMTLDEKLEQLLGTPGVVRELPQCFGARHVDGIPRLQIPTFRITNGPVGIGQNDCVPLGIPGLPFSALSNTQSAKATAMPSSLAVAASFDPTVANLFGNVVGIEAQNLALHVLEAPGINLARLPQGGRNSEYFGEDPLLSGVMAVNEIRAVQSHGIIAMAKHFVANEQETNRFTIDEAIDDRTLHELYLLPFEMAVKDGEVASIMCSYISVNGTHMCENKHLLTDVLRAQWGFKGYVQSDFFAVHSVAPTLLAGMDQEMPGLAVNSANPPLGGPYFTPENLLAALKAGDIAEGDINTILARRYTQMFRLGIFDRLVVQTPVDAATDGKLARRIGEQSAVLLKNADNALPLDVAAIHSIAVIGQLNYASKAVSGCCGGSSDVVPLYTVAPVEGLQNALRELGASTSVSLTIVNTDGSNLAQAVAAAASADAALVLAGAITEEGEDRLGLSLPDNQDAMISAVAAANRRTIVVLKDGDAISMPWIDQVPAVLEAWFPGEEDGNIVGRLLFGLVNPSGKLPITYPKAERHVPAHAVGQYPGVDVNGAPTVVYSEGLKIGYRWFDDEGIQPLFPFGHGLSYTTFSIADLEVSPRGTDGSKPIVVEFTVQNTGRMDGAEVPQIYLGMPASSGEPPKRLVAFEKVRLNPGEKQRVRAVIDPDANSHPFGYWDENEQQWATLDCTCQILVGRSATDLPLSQTITVRRGKRSRDGRH